jgi:hypothetical protein
VTVALTVPAAAQQGTPVNRSANAITFAAFGDWPYSNNLLANAAPYLVGSINSDPKVRLVVHVGDIHSGSMPCTGAGLQPLPAGSAPGWNESIWNVFQQFKDPVVYTPGDNEWSDCHKAKQLSSGNPWNELLAVRNLFFPAPGLTLGARPTEVISQATDFDPGHPEDAAFVENVMWEQSHIVFVTINLPGGSNDDTTAWTAPFNSTLDQANQLAERTYREAANLRWLGKAFDLAEADGAVGVVAIWQADVWDLTTLPNPGLSAYTPLVSELANRSVEFGKPVLLLCGDSHTFKVDHPLADHTSATGVVHNTQDVPNLTRIVVQGALTADGNNPRQWLRVTADPRDPAVFSWQHVYYCQASATPGSNLPVCAE